MFRAQEVPGLIPTVAKNEDSRCQYNCETTRCHTPESSNLNIHCCEKLKSLITCKGGVEPSSKEVHITDADKPLDMSSVMVKY